MAYAMNSKFWDVKTIWHAITWRLLQRLERVSILLNVSSVRVRLMARDMPLTTTKMMMAYVTTYEIALVPMMPLGFATVLAQFKEPWILLFPEIQYPFQQALTANRWS